MNKPSDLPAKLRSRAEKMFREDQIEREHEFRSLWKENKENQGSCKEVIDIDGDAVFENDGVLEEDVGGECSGRGSQRHADKFILVIDDSHY